MLKVSHIYLLSCVRAFLTATKSEEMKFNIIKTYCELQGFFAFSTSKFKVDFCESSVASERNLKKYIMKYILRFYVLVASVRFMTI